jgi:predicted transcriptional regulator
MTIPFELQMIDRVSGVQLFSHRFREDIKLEPTLISGFISAVITFAEEIKPSEGKEIIKYIDRGDFVLQVEPGQHVIGLLILSSKDYSFKEKLKILVNEFETKYKKEIVNWNGFSSCFLEFEEQVKQMISKKPLSPYHIPQLVNSDRPPQKIDDMKWAIITHINGQNDINTISEKLDLSCDVVQSIIAYFEETGLVQTHFKITDNSVIELTKKGLLSLEVGSDDYNEVISYVGEDAIKVLSIIGNERSIAEIKTEVPLNHMKITELIEKLVSDRYLEILPQWKLVLDKKAFQFTRSLEFIDDVFEFIFDESDNWLGAREIERVKRDTIALLIIKDEDLSRLVSDQNEYLIDRNILKNLLTAIGDLNKLAKRMETLFKVLQANIEREIGSNLTRDIFGKVTKKLVNEYEELLQQQPELETFLNWLT